MPELDTAAFDTDVLVIGGGPAGLAAAIAARRRGFRVVLADAAHPPIDKSCGEGLMPEAIDALAQLGVSIPAESCRSFHGIRFIDGESIVDGSFPAQAGLAVRRTMLHETLVGAAEAVGVALWWDAQVTALSSDGAIIDGQNISCRWLIGADGGQSRVRKWAGLRAFETSTRYGFRRHYRIAPWTDRVEVHWGPDFQIYIAPVAADEVCVALLSRDPHLRVDEALESFPDLAGRLASVEHLSQERGGISAMRKLPVVSQGRIALVGDASGSVDAITGQGLCLAFEQALALADCLVSGDLDTYEIAHRKIMRRPRIMARLLLAMDANPVLRSTANAMLARHPRIFQWLLAFHVGAVSRTFGSIVPALKTKFGSRAALSGGPAIDPPLPLRRIGKR